MTDTTQNQHQEENNPARKLVEESMKANDDANNLDQIRQLLFGDQVKDVEQKRQDLRQELKLGLSTLQHETRSQFEQISADIETLHRLLNDETEQRLNDDSQINARIDDLNSALQDANQRHEAAQSTLSNTFEQETKRLEADAREANKDILAKLDEAARELKSDKADRGDLAKLLRGVAEQLLDEHR